LHQNIFEMRYFTLLVIILLAACKSSQTDLPLLQECPGDGDCEVEVFKESRLILKEDNTGITEVTLEQDKDFQVVFVKYRDSTNKGYSEEVYLQIPLRFKEIHSENHSLKNQKVMFGKLCDCPDKGFEKINSGVLKLINLNDYISLHLEIKSNKSQVVQTIDLDI
jgi:hypothetical protein